MVGPPLLTITRGSMFVLSEPDGCITAYTDQGIYSRDTRFVSNYEIYADGYRWVLQNSGAVAYYAAEAYLTNPRISTEYGDIEPGTLSLIFSRAVQNCIHEDFDIYNYSMKPARFSFEISLRTDFADIFEVKAKRVVRKGNVTTRWDQEKSELTSNYEHAGFERSLITRLLHSDSIAHYSNGRISFLVDLPPRASWHACCQHLMDQIGSSRQPHRCVHLLRKSNSELESELSKWRKATTSLTTSNEDIYRLFKQSLEDMAALRLPQTQMPGQDEFVFIPAAGVPWFVGVFGRD